MFTAILTKSLSFLWGNTIPFYVSMLAIGIIRNWDHLMEAKKFLDERGSLRQWTWLFAEPQSKESTPTPTSTSSSAVLNLLSVLKKKDPEECCIETTASVPQDLADIRKTFLERYKPQVLDVQRDDGVLLFPNDLDSPILVDE